MKNFPGISGNIEVNAQVSGINGSGFPTDQLISLNYFPPLFWNGQKQGGGIIQKSSSKNLIFGVFREIENFMFLCSFDFFRGIEAKKPSLFHKQEITTITRFVARRRRNFLTDFSL